MPADALEIVPGLAPQPGDIRITKRGWSAFAGTPLDARLAERDVTQVVIAGIATSFGVESTARYAYDAGYHVTIALDAITDLDVGAHERGVTRVFPVLGETGTTDQILTLL
ncbi:isochorismatase family cysteine hydrolase [Acrocarpospora macrocephala]|uniref:cysteine hydrolase family protein n=1 Tax=Acrocarpospora macrocephala TaxID=150177 RepID=UPI0031D3AE61